ncbi:MAG: hypothetical protein A3H50_00320 [Candidatus Levybacteria bacterium RIFCSPLOWO2_02_FULL_37_10]|nr:MAG: hypothetical protein A2860_03760 [Candidatus Levybacteria bacterium RIFCSPHIGHO2_01_FULL_37_33]OGH17544.1 MAG: hypothetical protein A3C97_01900 [Candidatus Levybacteria bacterium RIFCSPHIGHO2_02_FULL_37_11]OGH30066.1 MAG: hypothetical protein A3F30_03640 [Candidatus Levybacteria bacterium RIFCSPHIGHO2_12_FULL_37_12]OGH32360.1 MAG: hypothetical protein A2953_01800 [Candidatus Levybacteria bacterium RIFCSPLOWO2_01_FULL_36_54]OGH46318.1 MAG: hypothetical protein A3H50_00320 [Candidatus Lev
MTNIVVLGGGFAGVAAGLSLLKHIKNQKIILIDKNSFHLFTPSLYEVATSEEPMRNIAIPFKEIFGDKAEIITGAITSINPKTQRIKLKDLEISYDYLILALGSEPAYYDIAGLSEYSLPLKTITDAVKIKDSMHKLYDLKAPKNEMVSIIIGGGGFSGTELAAELLEYVYKLSKEHSLPPNLIKICIIAGSEKLLKELDDHVSNIATTRLKKLGADFIFGSHIKEVFKNKLTTDKNQEFSFDILIWTGGVKANSLLQSFGLVLSKSGQVEVNEFLQTKEFPNFFAVGDIAEFIDPVSKRPAPGVAQVAEEEGKIAGENIARLIEKKPLVPYKLKHFGYIVPLRGRYAVFATGTLHIKGFFGWIIQQFIFLRYLLGILPFYKAFRKWNQFEKDLRQE